MTHKIYAMVLAFLPGACGGAERCGPAAMTVKRVIDGDTVELADGERVRYLMVDAPEITDGHMDCYGAEARDLNRALVEGREVSLRYDVRCTDTYGRLLAYVSVDGREVNSLLVERGFACVLHIPPDGNDRLDEFTTLERAAQSANRGLWGNCDSPSCR
jgi:micrococcal nuclease